MLHDPADGRMGVGSICGPKIGTWYVSSAGSAFTVVSHDASETGDGLGGAAEPAKLHRIYVTRARQGLPQDMASLQAGDTGLDDDEKLIWTSAEATDKLAAVRMAGFTLLTDSLGETGVIQADVDGIFSFGFNALVDGLAMAQGASITLNLMHTSGTTTDGTGFAVKTSHFESDDDVSLVQNVACNGLINLKKDDQIWWQNDSGATISVTSATFYLARFGPYQSPLT